MRSALPLVLAAGLAGRAHAAPIAELTRDLDGDGSADRVTLAQSGELTIETKRGKSRLALGAGVQRATLGAAQHRGTPLVLVDTGTHGIVVGMRGTRWVELLRTPIGGVGIDADYAIVVEATPEGIYRYQTRPGAQRCDGTPAYLFAEGFNGTKFQRLSKLPLRMPENAPVITARRDPDAASASLLYKARFASHQPGAINAGALGIPAELDDGEPATAWREDLVASAGEGQFFTYVPRFADARATQIRIVPGTHKGANRPRRLGIVTKTGAWHVELPDAQKDPPNSAYVADLPLPVEGCVTVVLESTYGPPRGTTAIGELAVFGDGERAGGGEAVLARVVASGRDGAKSAAQALARLGASGVAAITAELARTTDPAARARLVRAAVAIRDPSVGPLLARAAEEDLVDGATLVELIGALSGLGQAQALHDLAARSALPLEARVAAARALAPRTEKDVQLLVALAGRGPRELRQAVIDQLSELPVSALVPAAQGATEAKTAGDVWRAITRRAHVRPAERAPALAAVLAALPTATDYERRYRLVDAVAALGDAAALRQLAAMLARLPDGAETAAFKQVAARAIEVNPRAEAADLLIALTRDRDPGVRLTALSAIAGATATQPGPWHGDAGPDGIDRVIMTMLARDTWPEVRRSAAQVLGARCQRPGPARALEDAVARDSDVAVRGDALTGLVTCKAPGIATLLARLWDDSAAPIELRQRAVDLTVALGDAQLGGRLVGKLAQWRSGAIESEAALALAQSAAFAIGRLAPPGAADALAGALGDAAFPEIVSAAATGLGLLGPACTPAARQKLVALARSDEQQVQTAARRAAAQCGKRR